MLNDENLRIVDSTSDNEESFRKIMRWANASEEARCLLELADCEIERNVPNVIEEKPMPDNFEILEKAIEKKLLDAFSNAQVERKLIAAFEDAQAEHLLDIFKNN